ncbi:MAG: site-2 protease family protein [Candidatus Nitrohelix vancouverensis]|uniref:Site-2 protease family protein n=1 Tax=Candidatus Nitrohelix vancouverensis TaxID=2705534 RepID=A0A7T0G472_9BACT|nr:MAG: site-2 protease family protein [Candidatus Nitrohelix vancouverensis]
MTQFDDISSDTSSSQVREIPESPGTKQWLVFSALLCATVLTMYLAGGALFAISLLLILGAHEFGHYWAGRRNRVKVSLPYFMPAPPMFIAGTFGAFIQIKDPIPDRDVLMEIGASGPIAGFIVALIALWIGLSLSEVSTVQAIQGISFGGSIILAALSKIILGVTPFSNEVDIQLHPIAFAGWIGMFITALNLIPVGQLDGGHILYALFFEKYLYLARICYLALIPLGFLWSGWWFWAVLILIAGIKPAPLVFAEQKLSPFHRKIGLLCILIFALTFVPVPFMAIGF